MRAPHSLLSLLLLPLLCSGETLDPLLLGTWENRTQGDLVGIELKLAETCELYVERALQKRSSRACKYSAFEDRFQIFLADANGQCGTTADFEFIFEPGPPLIRLQTGSSEVLLQKIKTAPNGAAAVTHDFVKTIDSVKAD